MEIEVAMVYAEALYGAAKDLGEVEEIRDEITQIDQILRKSRDFSELFLNPAMSAAEKQNILKHVFDGRVQKEVLNFMYILVDKGRTTGFHEMVRQYCRLMDDAEGISEGVIYSAYPVTDEQLQKFEAETSRLFRRKVHLKNRVDKSLLGGVRLFVDGKMIDASAQHKLEQMANEIRVY